ncbi:MAG TPA: TIGR02186 family protein, partial [Alphaproteobacteria bacterium]|nr:TIGR02186 family protein [Alphaproteobacteria bacterium]
MRALHTILLAAALLASVAGVARNQASAQPLVADLSDHLIAVTTGFSGAKLLLFGAMDPQEGGDIVVVVRGPLRDLVVRRKDRIAGVWINNDAVEYRRVPSYYHLASTRPLTEIANAHVLAGLQIGLD